MKRRRLSERVRTSMKKMGLSEVVTVLIFVLLGIVAVSIVWVVVLNVIHTQSSTATLQSQLFGQHIGLTSISFSPSNPLQMTMSIQRGSGVLSVETNITNPQKINVNVIAVSDLSGSMGIGSCLGISYTCCSSLGGSYSGGNCTSITYTSAKFTTCSSTCGGTIVDGLYASRNASKQLVDTILSNSSLNKVGIVAYSGSVLSSYSSDLTGNSANLKNIISSWTAGGSTNICGGINNATGRLQGLTSDASKAMIVMTDGGANVRCYNAKSDLNGDGKIDGVDDAIQSACDAYNSVSNLTIYAVGLGPDADMATIDAIAECGHGENFSASNINDLIDVYKSLAAKIINKYSVVGQKSFLRILFYDANKSVSRDVSIPGPQETKTYSFDLTGDLTPPIIKIEIYPVLVTDSGQQVVGPLFDSWKKS